MPAIALITDFGLVDEYVGIIKGVIHSFNPSARVIDISHNISPQDIRQAAMVLNASYTYFPPETIFVVIVDPGVGSNRRIIAAHIDSFFFIVPDNGVLTPLLPASQEKPAKASHGNSPVWRQGVHVINPDYFLKTTCQTFHGRDIFAPVAAHLSKGLELSNLGPPVAPHSLTVFKRSPPILLNDAIEGYVEYIDHFGNLITNIDAKQLQRLNADSSDIHSTAQQLFIIIGKEYINGLSDSYAGVKKGQLLAVISSRNFIEISVNCGNAQKITKTRIGDPVRIKKAV